MTYFTPGREIRLEASLTPAELQEIMPRCDVDVWHPLLLQAMAGYDIYRHRARVCCFLAQIAHESGECRRLEEGLSYSAERLQAVWPRRFPTLQSAEPYARNPEALANKVYADRIGNGPEASGDGWRFRGGGLVQLTGRGNYSAAAMGTGLDLVEHPEQLREPGEAAALSAGWFWASKGCNELADACDPDASLEAVDVPFRRLTRRINGGYVGLEDRLAYWDRARKVVT